MSNRRTNAVNGFVNFSVNSGEYVSSKEGGMFVRLVVIPPQTPDKWMMCCGGNNYVQYDESFIGRSEEKRHFPKLDSVDYENDAVCVDSTTSIPYLAVLTIGSTGWSGYNQGNGYWRCTYGDLTEAGKTLYNQLKQLYSGCELVLQTWLDT